MTLIFGTVFFIILPVTEKLIFPKNCFLSTYLGHFLEVGNLNCLQIKKGENKRHLKATTNRHGLNNQIIWFDSGGKNVLNRLKIMEMYGAEIPCIIAHWHTSLKGHF